MKKFREKISDYADTAIGAGIGVALGLATLGSPDQAEASPYAGAELNLMRTNPVIEEMDEINDIGNELSDEWENVELESALQIGPSVKIGTTANEMEDSRIDLEAGLGPTSTNTASKETTYDDADFGFGEEEIEVKHESVLDALRGNVGIKYVKDFEIEENEDIDDASVYAKVGGQMYRIDFDSETEYVIPARNTSIIDDAEGSGTVFGPLLEAGGEAQIKDNLKVYGNVFRGSGSGDISGRTRRRTGHGSEDSRDLEGEVDISDYGAGFGIVYEF